MIIPFRVKNNINAYNFSEVKDMRLHQAIGWHCLSLFLFLAIIPLFFTLVIGNKITDAKQDFSANSPEIRVLLPNGSEEILPLDQYLVGVIAAEMPANFPEEALKAQAVAARTYILRFCAFAGGTNKHGAVNVCSSPAHCQAYIPPEDLAVKWGNHSQSHIDKISRAVTATAGLILTYEGKLVTTPYSAVCGGKSADCAETWGSYLPWLISVDCPFDQEAPKYSSQVSLTLEEAAAKLGITLAQAGSLRLIRQGDSGRVIKAAAGNQEFSGSELRQKLGLNSTFFSWIKDGNNLIFQVKGHGHGVGLCQWGARGMAVEGYDFESILAHYYSGTELAPAY